MRKFIYGLAGLIATVAIVAAGNYGRLTSITGAQDPSQLSAVVNGVINNYNSTSPGLLYVNAVAETTATTSEETLYTYTLPGGYLSTNGQSLRVRCHAQTANTANNKTLILYFGAATVTTGAVANQNAGEFLEYIVTRTSATTQMFVASGQTGAAGVTNLAPTFVAATETLSADIEIKCTATDATAAAGTLGKMMTVESLR